LAIEIDGLIHTTDDHPERDERRDEWLRGQGIDTYRIAASEVMADPDEVALGFCLLAKDRAALRLSGPLRPDCAGHLRRFAREKRVK
jgi:very-short-patch-repair endonuclease